MPNPKRYCTMEWKAVTSKAGKIDFKVDKYGIVHAIGKVSFDPTNAENAVSCYRQLLS